VGSTTVVCIKKIQFGNIGYKSEFETRWA